MIHESDDFLQRLIDGDPSLGLLATAPAVRRKRFATALLMERESAQEAGMLGYQAQILVQCSLPYRRQLLNEWTRTNGNVTLTLWAPKAIGLPYGAYPRLILTWVTTEAVRTRSRELDLHDSLTRFIREIGINKHATGPQIRRFRDQTRRLFATTITASLTDDREQVYDTGFRLASELRMWWDPVMASTHDPAHLVLSEEFYRAITKRAIPVDFRALNVLKGSALALDIYSWLVHRLSYLKKPTTIPWELLQVQFGGEYASNKSGRYNFKMDFQRQLEAVLQIYPEAKVTADKPRRLDRRDPPTSSVW